MRTIKEMRTLTGLSQSKFALYLGIPESNIKRWEQGQYAPREFIVSLVERVLVLEGMIPKEDKQ